MKRCPNCKRHVGTRYNLDQILVFIAHKDKQGNVCDKSDKPVP